jgi:hypothetical protein
MSYKQAIGRTTIRMYDLDLLLLSDLSDADLLVRPVPRANHIAWQLGHLIIQESELIGSQDLGVKYPELGKGFVEQHSDATAGVDPPSGFLTKAEYLDLLAQTHRATMETLAKLSDADLDRPVKGNVGTLYPTLGDLFLAPCNNNGVHQGQFSIVRRLLGKPVLY